MRQPDMQQDFEGSNRQYVFRKDEQRVGSFDVIVPPHRRLAWRVACSPKNIDQTATLAQWLVHCPHLHAAWSYWWICLVHLRDIPGVQPAQKDFPQAEYELSIYAQDPEREPDPDAVHDTMQVLRPVDVCEQFHGPTDAQAIDMAETLVKSVVKGLMSPDSDFRAAWKAQISLCVEHITTSHGKVDA